jgi:cytidylate kinase
MSSHHHDRFHAALTTLRTAVHSAGGHGRSAAATGPPTPFVTISRQAGSGGKTLAKELALALTGLDPLGEAWSAWDHELVEKVAAEHQIPESLVDALEDGAHPWFGDFLKSLSSAAHHDEAKIYRRFALAARTLAVAGRAVIVGRGGVFVTAGVEGGVHVRLVAPLDHRVGRMAERLKVTTAEAADRVREVDRNREHFYKRHWPDMRVVPETFTVTLNTAQLSDAQMVACLVPLLVEDERQRDDRQPPARHKTGSERAGAY